MSSGFFTSARIVSLACALRSMPCTMATLPSTASFSWLLEYSILKLFSVSSNGPSFFGGDAKPHVPRLMYRRSFFTSYSLFEIR